jgi:hypothetical protein
MCSERQPIRLPFKRLLIVELAGQDREQGVPERARSNGPNTASTWAQRDHVFEGSYAKALMIY